MPPSAKLKMPSTNFAGRRSKLLYLSAIVSIAAMLWTIPHFGPHHDENFFIKPVFRPDWAHASVTLFNHQIPLMLMPYTGAPKVLLYQAIFSVFQPSLWTLRLPMLAMILASLFLMRAAFHRLGFKKAGDLFAILLVTSPMILFTTVYDWGPVCLQMFCLAAAFYCWSHLTPGWLFLSAFFCGFGAWEKMTFVICYGPLFAVLFLIVLRPKTVLPIAAGLILGASPLLYYNYLAVAQPVTTLLSWEATAPVFALKFKLLGRALIGSSLVGYLTSAQFQWPRILAYLLSLGSYAYWLTVAVIVAATLTPGKTRLLRCLILFASTISWFTMAAFQNLGAAAHHTVLFLPLLFALLVLALEDAPPLRFLLAMVLLFNCASFADMLFRITYQPIPTVWSPAILQAAQRVVLESPSAVFTDDWGLENAVVLLSGGKIVPLNGVNAESIKQPGALYMGFTPGKQSFPQNSKLLADFARQNGLSRQVVESFDGTVELYKFTPLAKPEIP